MKKTCIILIGPTAIGKTALAIQLAQHFSTEIISADSRQCFTELNIGVAKPVEAELKLIPHHFINSHSIHENVNAAVYEKYALQAAQDIFKKSDIAIIAGGTGLYVKTFCEGIDEVPIILPGIRENIVAGYEANGIEWLQQQVMEKDPAWYQQGEVKNPHRLMRALEVIQSTNKSLLQFQTQEPVKRDFEIIKIGLELPREILYQRINERVEQMMKDGLEAEVRLLQSFKTLNALQTVGYKELFSYFDHELSLDEAVALIQQNTRHYAKRQMTWFKKDKTITWCASKFDALIKNVNAAIQAILN
ncbi:MAG: tRNA (adenosine(37)-N6)-dimethylallyltransferase MiaA [Ferruginibacter sp.]